MSSDTNPISSFFTHEFRDNDPHEIRDNDNKKDEEKEEERKASLFSYFWVHSETLIRDKEAPTHASVVHLQITKMEARMSRLRRNQYGVVRSSMPRRSEEDGAFFLSRSFDP